MPQAETIYSRLVSLLQNLTNANILPRTTHDLTVNLQPTRKTYDLRPRKAISYKV